MPNWQSRSRVHANLARLPSAGKDVLTQRAWSQERCHSLVWTRTRCCLGPRKVALPSMARMTIQSRISGHGNKPKDRFQAIW
ncbi:hypothetical protein I7I50_10651 [Histoplasma capsulatum G186AR]|uniref:Uncharacterized protein n=1 Tax=Ajellomyces capsulatus TaxID=5037 RepID=A0A8H7Z8L1_AJECA|nr:hypothetical protein I7I52_01889 [Histoplasma capsulatum]QSS69374.1 hypothetical protein I7I50_10651 [Histoplasma capsulatum G186AR]